MARTYNVVDADGHILEPLDLWDRYIDPELRERRPRFVIDENGKERLSVEGKLLGNPRGIGSLGAVGVRQGAVKLDSLKYALGWRCRSPPASARRISRIGRRLDGAVARSHGPPFRRSRLQRYRPEDSPKRTLPAQLLDLVRAGGEQHCRVGRLYRAAQDHVGDRLSASGRLLSRSAADGPRPARAVVAPGQAPSVGRRRPGILRHELRRAVASRLRVHLGDGKKSMSASQTATRCAKAAPVLDFDAVIIGAGVSGLYQLYRLRELGLRARILETGSGVGGTWYWNRYPGARFDSESYTYAYSLSQELLEAWNWAERFAVQAEHQRYLNHVADKFDLRRDIQFNSRVAAASYYEETRSWDVALEDGRRYSTRVLITHIALLTAATMPRIAGV